MSNNLPTSNNIAALMVAAGKFLEQHGHINNIALTREMSKSGMMGNVSLEAVNLALDWLVDAGFIELRTSTQEIENTFVRFIPVQVAKNHKGHRNDAAAQPIAVNINSNIPVQK